VGVLLIFYASSSFILNITIRVIQQLMYSHLDVLMLQQAITSCQDLIAKGLNHLEKKCLVVDDSIVAIAFSEFWLGAVVIYCQ
jgi:hypothetical protein